MRMEHLECLLQVVRSGSINKAGQKLNTSPQNVSKLLKQLEDELETTLLLRQNQVLELTENGRLALRFAEHVLDELDELKGQMHQNRAAEDRGELKGEVALFSAVTSSMACLRQVVPAFCKQYPKIRFNQQEVNSQAVYEQLAKQEDCIGLVPVIVNADGSTMPSYQAELAYHLVKSDKFVVLVSRRSPLAKQKSITPSSILRQPLGIWATDNYRESLAYQYLCQYGDPNLTYITNNIYHFLNGINEERFIGFSTAEIFKDQYSPLKNDICRINLKGYHEYNHMLIVRRDVHLSAAGKAFVQFVKQFYD